VEFAEVVRRRRMVRSYLPRPLSRTVVDRIVDAGLRAPAAGNTSGRSFLILEREDATGLWSRTTRADKPRSGRWARLQGAAVVVLILVNPSAYQERYAEPDKTGAVLDPRWPHVDAGMAVMSMLLAATAEGVGALFFALTEGLDDLRSWLGVPDEMELVGAVSLGWPDPDDPPSASARRPRPSREDVVRYGRWGRGS
jgi:nitroreductase